MTCDGTALRLHGNAIAAYGADGALLISMSNWGSVTTRERLNGLLDSLHHPIRLGQKDSAQVAYDIRSRAVQDVDKGAWYAVEANGLREVAAPF
jgi:hypothetical protein